VCVSTKYVQVGRALASYLSGSGCRFWF